MAKTATNSIQHNTKRKYSRVQRKGQVTIPIELRSKLGIQEGDLVTFTETDKGVLISSQKEEQKEELHRALDALGDGLRAAGISLEDLIESGRQIREEIAREKYGFLFEK